MNVVSLKNIDICPSYGQNKTKFGPHAQIWAYVFWAITQPFLVQFQKERYPDKQETSSYKQSTHLLGFDHVCQNWYFWPKNGRGRHAPNIGHRDFGTPSKVPSHVLLFGSTTISKSTFTKNLGCPPSPNKALTKAKKRKFQILSYNRGKVRPAILGKI